MARSYKLKINADANTRGARKDLNLLEKSMDSLKSSWKGAAAGLAKGGAVGLGALATGFVVASAKSVQLASDAEETANKLNVVFGKELKKVNKELRIFADATGASYFALQEQAASMGALLKPLGLTNTQVRDMSTNMVKLATDMSSFNNVPVEEAFNALRSGITGETEPLKRFGVVLNQASIEAEALASKLVAPVKNQAKIQAASVGVEKALKGVVDAQRKHGKGSLEARDASAKLGMAQQRLTKELSGSKVELTASQKAQATYNLAMKQTKIVQGDAERTSKGYANVIRGIRNAIRDAATEYGMRLLPAVTEFAIKINKFVRSEKFREWIDEAGKKVAGFVKKIANYVSSDKFKDHVKEAAKGAEQFGRAAKDAADAILEISKALAKLEKKTKAVRGTLTFLRDAFYASHGNAQSQKKVLDAINPAGDSPGEGGFLGRMMGAPSSALRRWGLSSAMSPAVGLGASMGLRVSSGLRPGARTKSGSLSDHATGHAVDMVGSAAQMLNFAITANRLPGVKQVIYSPWDGWSDDHYDHVHVAMGGRAHKKGTGDSPGSVSSLGRVSGSITSEQALSFARSVSRPDVGFLSQRVRENKSKMSSQIRSKPRKLAAIARARTKLAKKIEEWRKTKREINKLEKEKDKLPSGKKSAARRKQISVKLRGLRRTLSGRAEAVRRAKDEVERLTGEIESVDQEILDTASNVVSDEQAIEDIFEAQREEKERQDELMREELERRKEAEEENLQAQLDQANQRAFDASQNLAASEGAFAALSGPGDIGSARGANALQSAANVFYVSSNFAPTPQQLVEYANATAQGIQFSSASQRLYSSVTRI